MIRSRLLAAVMVVGALVAGSLPTRAQQVAQVPSQACDSPTRSMSLFAEKVGKRKIGYGLRPGKATVPGPTIEMTEGDCLHVTLVNDTDKKLSMHSHGVAYTVRSDGTGINDSCVAPGRSRTYVFSAPPQSTRADGTVDPGSAGYFHYHDHCFGTHGTQGVRKGLYGALIVRRAGDPEPTRRPFVLVMRDITFNNRKAPRTPRFRAAPGERVEFVVIGHGDLMHTFHLHGHRWVDNRTGLPTGLSDDAAIIDNKTVGPADSFGFQVVAGEHVGPGAWMYHCHVQGHSDAGMSGLLVVEEPDGTLSEETRAAIERWERTHGGEHGH